MKNKLITLLILISFSLPAFCYTKHKPAGFGHIAQTMMEPVSALSEFVTNASLIIGIAFLFGAFLRYMQHRTNPLAVPLSSVVTLFILGAILILLPLAYKLSL